MRTAVREENAAGLRVLTVIAALLPRLLIAWVALGGVDSLNNLRNGARILSGLPVETPYLPGVDLWIWVGSVIGYATSLPITFGYKLLPIAFDALIALLLFDSADNKKIGFCDGLLYALAPIPILITAMHGQWDGIWMYFLLLAVIALRSRHPAGPALSGVALVLSIIVKPIAAPLALLLVPRTRRAFFTFVAGAAAAGAIYVGIAAATHVLPTLDALAGIVRYANQGVSLFGLPYRPFDRVWAGIVVAAMVTILSFLNRLRRGEAVLLFLTALVGLSALSVQYLMWVVPFAILAGRRRFLALYTLIAGVFVALYYACPAINLPNTENLGGYAMLRPFGLLGPPPPRVWMQTVEQILGNYAIPLLCLAFAAWWLIQAATARETVSSAANAPRLGLYVVPLAIVLCCALSAVIWARLQPAIAPAAFVVKAEEKIGRYDAVRYRGTLVNRPGTKIWIARSLVEPGVSAPLHAMVIAVLWVAAATAQIVIYDVRRR